MRGVISVPEIVEKNKINEELDLTPDPRGLLHGKECEILGRWDFNGWSYAAVKFPWHERHQYEIFKNSQVLDG